MNSNEKKETIGSLPHAQKIMDKLKVNRSSLNISRVPPDVKKRFIDLADKDFCGDYGFLLKFLMDDLIQPDSKMLIEAINQLEERMVALENRPIATDEPETKNRTMLDGSKRGVEKK